MYWHILALDDVYRQDGRNLHTFYSCLNTIAEMMHCGQQSTVVISVLSWKHRKEEVMLL